MSREEKILYKGEKNSKKMISMAPPSLAGRRRIGNHLRLPLPGSV